MLVALEPEPRPTLRRRPSRSLVAARRAAQEQSWPLYLQQRIVPVKPADRALNRSRGTIPQSSQQVSWRRRGDGGRRNVLKVRRHMVTRSLFGPCH